MKNYKVPKDIISFYENFEPRVVYADKSWFLFNEEERKLEFSFYPFEIEEEWDAEDYYECIGNKS
ncbi:hypothetical protein [Clostridium coskatii]|uniref:hypothetical protein n=1 Tax=Clostridium coskatii TaxID=1705578 RepID=UPI0007BEE58A|nr:hypothetical protein [Clostridium coskatii]